MATSFDDVHYNAIRKALANGNAAVMVGAGFSRNAENGDSLALWSDIAKELWRELNPSAKELKDYSVSTVTQLGEQYSRVFSKPALEEVLKRLIPDERIRPGVLHDQLLQLPWSEIFTTNYDTLLERAAESIVERAHHTVTCREDIPQSKILSRRRIVKLHGSFPSQRPFIFTEDDYRRYPEKFAPFVNLVRQSLLENVFCLIGFSGDDPNFLYWIGWVRDMLDKHSLPIYLFLSKHPTLGQKALLEARNVTPVVLPQPAGCEEHDYSKRFSELFRLLSSASEDPESSWGKAYFTHYERPQPNSSTINRTSILVDAYAQVSTLHETYPGWMIAPKVIRTRLRRNIENLPILSGQGETTEYLLKESPYVGVVLFAEYAWIQEATLQCWQDECAPAAIEMMKATKGSFPSAPDSQHEYLAKLHVFTTTEFHSHWRDLGISLLRWARQELRRAEFNDIKTLLETAAPSDFYLVDEIAYESILFSLFEGDRDIALNLVDAWVIRSSDSYMYIRKGMLWSELGKIKAGLSVSLEGLQKLRLKQKLHFGSTKYLSQEAWACLVIDHLQQVTNWEEKHSSPSQSDETFSAQLNRRLNDLATSGHDPRRDIETIISDLNGEIIFPLQPTSYTPIFAPGRYSTTQHLSGSSELNSKIQAAFAWHTLCDRICLTPRIGNSTINIDSFTQAAWWVQYSDSMERVLSLMIRTLHKNLLKPRNQNQLPHKAGWLSRYQVARTEERLAINICKKSLSLIERLFKNPLETDDIQRVIGFHMEVFSRLVIRIQDASITYDFIGRIITLHNQPALESMPEIWKDIADALSHCFEALPPTQRLSIALDIAIIPDINVINALHYKDQWVSVHKLRRRDNDLLGSADTPEAISTIQELINQLQSSYAKNPSEAASTGRIWQRLFWLKTWGFISDDNAKAIESIFHTKDHWPIIPDHHPWASFTWLEHYQGNAASEFKAWLLKQSLNKFSATIPEVSDSRKSWKLSDDEIFLSNFRYSFDEVSWSTDEMVSGLEIIRAWWNSEWSDITPELSRPDSGAFGSIQKAVSNRLEIIDAIFAALHQNTPSISLLDELDIGQWVNSLPPESAKFGIYFWQYRISRAIKDCNERELRAVEIELVEHLLDSDLSKVSTASSTISYWFNFPDTNSTARPDLIIDTLAGIVAARRMPALPWGLNLMLDLALHKSVWMTESALALIDSGLKKMLIDLCYENPPLDRGIPDASVPTLRWSCAQLSKGLAKTIPVDSLPSSIPLWLDLASVDPLPELRFLDGGTN